MVRRDDDLKLGDAASCIGSLHITHGVVSLGSTGWIPADSMFVLRVGVGSEDMHIARATADRAIVVEIPRLRDRQAPMALRHTCSCSKKEGCDKAGGSHGI
jgi:hypothetical protein